MPERENKQPANPKERANRAAGVVRAIDAIPLALGESQQSGELPANDAELIFEDGNKFSAKEDFELKPKAIALLRMLPLLDPTKTFGHSDFVERGLAIEGNRKRKNSVFSNTFTSLRNRLVMPDKQPIVGRAGTGEYYIRRTFSVDGRLVAATEGLEELEEQARGLSIAERKMLIVEEPLPPPAKLEGKFAHSLDAFDKTSIVPALTDYLKNANKKEKARNEVSTGKTGLAIIGLFIGVEVPGAGFGNFDPNKPSYEELLILHPAPEGMSVEQLSQHQNRSLNDIATIIKGPLKESDDPAAIAFLKAVAEAEE